MISDIEHAFKEVLVDLQADLWERMESYQTRQFKRMPDAVITATRDAIVDYYKKTKNSKYIGIYYPFDFIDGGVYIALDHRLYCGYYFNEKEEYPEDYQRLLDLSKSIASNRSSNKLYWRYPKVNLNLRTPSNEDLAILRSLEEREALAQSLIDDAHELWTLAHKTLNS
ncbi:hypothetical protein D3C85_1424530 [compost metagenome]